MNLRVVSQQTILKSRGADGVTDGVRVGRRREVQSYPGAAMEEAGRKMRRSHWKGNQERVAGQVRKRAGEAKG